MNEKYRTFLIYFQSWEIDSHEGLAASEFCTETDSWCLMALPQVAAEYPKTTEPNTDTKFRDVCYVFKELYAIKTEAPFYRDS